MADITFKYGSYVSPACCAKLSNRSVTSVELNGFVVEHDVTMTFELDFSGTGDGTEDTSEINAQIVSLQNALLYEEVDCGLLYDGSPTAFYLVSSNTLGGTVLKSVQFPGDDLTLARHAKVSITVGAKVYNSQLARNVVAYNETVSVTGTGGPLIVLVPQAGALPIYQQIQEYTPITVVQSGTLIGRTSYPLLPTPIIADQVTWKEPAWKDTKVPQQRRLAVERYQRNYSFEFQLNELGAGVSNPGLLT